MKVIYETTLADILKNKKAPRVLKENGVPCLDCPMAASEIGFLSIGEVSQIYNLDIKKILKELNEK